MAEPQWEQDAPRRAARRTRTTGGPGATRPAPRVPPTRPPTRPPSRLPSRSPSRPAHRSTASQPAPTDIPVYAACGLFGLLGFAVGLLLDRWTPYPDLFSHYAAAYVMPAQVVVGLLLALTYALIAGRRGLVLWHGMLWALGGVAAGWVLWSIGLVVTAV